jgi:hypothetical protein
MTFMAERIILQKSIFCQGHFSNKRSVPQKRRDMIYCVAPVRLCDGFVGRRLGSATTKRSGDSHEIEPVILVGY